MEHYVGMLAATLTTVCFIPQAIKTIRTKQTQGISAIMYCIFNTGIACWLGYGLLLNNLPMIFANTITLPLTLTILVVKLKQDGFK